MKYKKFQRKVKILHQDMLRLLSEKKIIKDQIICHTFSKYHFLKPKY